MKKKGSRTLLVKRKTRPHAKASSRGDLVVISTQSARPNAYAKRALRVFKGGVKDALTSMRERGIQVTVVRGNETVRGIPEKTKRGFVVVEARRP